MKIRALRLAEVGPFTGGIALEGLSGGLDVLTGPNEMGKSTLFAALGMLLGERHTSTARAVSAMRPDSGGAPLIEADLQIGERVLRLRKRFLAQRMARLSDLGSGQVWHGSEAEAAVEQLLSEDARGVLRGLLWVAQGASFGLPEKQDATLAAGLARVIEQEAADASGAGQLRRLGLAVRERLEGLVTVKQGKAKAGGPLDDARRRRDSIAEKLEAARARATAAQVRLERRNALQAELASVVAPEAIQAIAEAAEAARKAVTDADEARRMLSLAQERAKARQLAFEHAGSRLAELRSSIDDAARIERSIADASAGMAEAGRLREELVARLQGAHELIALWDSELSAARQALHAAHVQRERAAALAELADADKRLVAARAAAGVIDTAQARLAGNVVTEGAVEHVRRLASQIEAMEWRIESESPRIAVTYRPGTTKAFCLDHVALVEGAQIAVDRRIEITVEGIGTITIEPGNGATLAVADERERARHELTTHLATLGVRGLAEANAKLAVRRRDEATLAEGRIQLKSAAPDGIAALEAARRAAFDKLGKARASETSVVEDPVVIEESVKQLEAQVLAARSTSSGIEKELGDVTTTIARLQQQLASLEQRHEELGVRLPPADAREAAVAELTRLRADAEAVLDQEVRERSAWAAIAPSAAAYDSLLAQAKQAAKAHDELGERRGRLERALAEVEGGLRRDCEDGVGAEIAGLEEELAVAQARVSDLEIDVDALSLLAARLDHFGSAHRDQILRPLLDRLQPLLGRLLPEACLVMEGPLLAVQLVRQERSDPFARVSGGTREQIATLVRIAYAQLMSSRVGGVPLVLDDALVYSDDQRLETMIALLSEAAQRHQVIVLSCHQRALDPLIEAHGGRRLALEPWDDVDREKVPAGRGSNKKGRALGSASNLL